MAEIVQHPSAGVAAEQPSGDERAWPGDLDLALETREMITMLKDEIGLKWCTFPLRLQIEKIERLLGDPYGL